MALKRLLKKTLFGGGNMIQGHIFDALDKKRKTGKPFRECLRESINETIQEDMPGTSHIYRRGRSDGKVQGIAEQAQKDEEKFRAQHEAHESDRKEWQSKRKEYEELLNDIENQ